MIVPLFAVGRAQEMQLVLENYMTNKPEYKIDVPVYLDGMILEASAIHTAYPEYLKESLRNRILNNRSPFESEIFEIIKGEREEIFEKGPPIILASGGMMNGGASLEYFKRLCRRPEEHHNIRRLQQLQLPGKEDTERPEGSAAAGRERQADAGKVNMDVKTVEGFSGHSDRSQLMSFVENLRPRPRTDIHDARRGAEVRGPRKGLGRIMHCDARAPMNLDSIRLK